MTGSGDTNTVYLERLQAYAGQFAQLTDFSSAAYMAQTMMYNELSRQAHLWAYVDSFRIFAVAGLIILLLIPLLRVKKA